MTGDTDPSSTFPELDELTVERLQRRTNAKWRKYEPDVIPAWVADMDFPVAPVVADLLRHHADEGDLGYASNDDDDVCRQAFCDWQARQHGWPVEVEHTRTIVDVLQGVATAVATLTAPGDGIILHTPAYHPFFPVISEADRRVIGSPLAAPPTYPAGRVDLDHLAEVAPTARALLLCNPHNPAGHVLDPDELRAIADVARRHDLVVIADEIHADLVHRGRHVPFASLDDDTASRTVTLTAATKAFAMPALNCAVMVAAPPLLDRLESLPKGMGGKPSAIGQRASTAAWTDGRPWLDAVQSRIRANLEHAVEVLTAAGLDASVPEATYLLWVDCRAHWHRRGWTDEPADRLLREARVGLDAGSRFGPDSAGWLRLNVATSRRVLDEILDRMTLALGAG